MAMQAKNEVDQLLAQSLKELAVKRPVEKITIKEITDKAGVIRPTFYNHFQDKFELIEWIIKTEILEPIGPLLSNGMITEGMELLFSNIAKDKPFYEKIVRMDGVITFDDIAHKCVKELLLAIITELMYGKETKHRWLTPEIIADYYAQSMCFAAEEWIRTGMVIPPREMAEAYQYIISRSMMDVINEL